MEKTDAVAARWRLPRTTGSTCSACSCRPDRRGMPAGAVAAALDPPPNTLTFHFDPASDGRGLLPCAARAASMIYAALFEKMNTALASSPKTVAPARHALALFNASPSAAARKSRPERRSHEASSCSCCRQRPLAIPEFLLGLVRISADRTETDYAGECLMIPKA